MPNSAVAAALAAALLLTGCSQPTPAPAVCRVGPDGGPVADKGIGGTGAPLIADKGIGGTGIVAVISGFASICLAGQEVALPADTPIVFGSEPGRASALRAGQVAVVDAAGAGSGLSARRVTIRFEVSGPVEAVVGDELRVAGQRVAVTAATLGARPAVGDWVAVSGIRRGDEVIEATRLTARQPGPVVVHGVLRRDGGLFHIGALVLAPLPGLAVLLDQNVTAAGALLLGRLEAETIEPDLLASDPARFFGPAVGVMLIEGFGEFGGDRLRLGQGFAVPARGAFVAGPHRGVFRLERGANGLSAVAESGAGGNRGGFAPAPLPNRGSSRPADATPFGREGGRLPRAPRNDGLRDGGGPGPGRGR